MAEHLKTLRISFNSPVVLGFFLICLLALALNKITGGWANDTFFSIYHSSMTDIFTYVRMVGHVFGHADWSHFMGNMTLLLIVGPLLEEKYGSYQILVVILTVALVTGMVNFIFFPRIQLLGASGVVFAFILLSSITSIEDGGIPLTFLLVALIYIGGQIYEGIFVQNNVANLTHIIGGVVGAILGYFMNRSL